MAACACEQAAVDLTPLEALIGDQAGQPGSLIPILQRAQEHYGFLPRPVLEGIARRTRTPLQQVFGVATFYSQFYLNRRGRHIIRQCDGTACHVRGAGKIVEAVEQELGLKPGETTPDYKITFEVVYCLGSCGLAPVAVHNDRVMGRLLPKDMLQTLRGLA